MEDGYGRFTMEGVVKRAGTSRPVLYRRWANRADLAIAAIRHQMRSYPVAAPDNGNVRDDLVALLCHVSSKRAGMALLVFVQMGQYFMETQSSPADLRERLLHGQQSLIDTILSRAVRRGEIDSRRLTPRIAALPGDLLRQEFMMTLKPVPDAIIVEIVDDIFLPLVRK